MTEELDPLRRRDPDPDPGPATPAAPRRARAASGIRRATPFIAGVAATFIALILYGLLNPPARPLSTRDVNQAIASALASQTLPPPRAELVYGAIQPSLVLIQTDEPGADPNAAHGLGAGVIVNDQGAILTALHVVASANSITLTFPDGSTTGASIVSRQPESDIAVLLPDSPPETIIPATLGNPASLRIGSDAYIVGNPFGLYGSLSAGVVSGLDRSFELPGTSDTLHGLIQVDAAVNPGNSGGPLVDRDGRVVGIVTALINPTKQDVFIGIGLAVPIDVAGGAAGLPPY